MIIEITRDADYVHAMGHRVALGQGGEAELKRRCYESLSRLDTPPDSVVFSPVGSSAIPREMGPEPPPQLEPAPAPAPEAQPQPEPAPEAEPPASVETVAALAPAVPPPVRPIAPPAPSLPRSHKKRA